MPVIVLLSVPTAFFIIQLRTDAEKRSLVESGLSWNSEDSNKLRSSSYDTGSLKTEAQGKWRKKTLSLTEESAAKGDLRKPLSFSQSGCLKKGRNPSVGITSLITHTSQGTLKVSGKTYWFLFVSTYSFLTYGHYSVDTSVDPVFL